MASLTWQIGKDHLLGENGETRLTISAIRADILHVRLERARIDPVETFALTDAARTARHPAQCQGGTATLRLETTTMIATIDTETTVLDLHDPQGFPILMGLTTQERPPHGFAVTASLDPETTILGLGDKTAPLDRRSRSFANWATDSYAFGEGQDPLYKAIPFFAGVTRGRAFGVFLDNPYRSIFDFGMNDPNILSFGAVDGAIEYYIMAGPKLADVVQAFAFLTGTPPLPPKWALGYQQSRYSYKTQAEVLTLAHRLRAEHIPCDVIWLDLHVLDLRRSFTIDHAAFPDFAGMVETLHRLGFALVIITDFQIAKVESDAYPPYANGLEQDVFVRRDDGSVYEALSWGGQSVFPDFTLEKARAWWGALYTELVEAGVDGFWNDMNEPALFSDGGTFAPDVLHRMDDGTTRPHAAIHNLYGTLNGRATFEGLETLRPTSRPFVMMRASFAGGQRHAVTWTGDNLSTWAHLRLSTPMLLSLGLSGFAFAGVNLGGFVGTPSPDLLTRWLQIGMYNPIALNHSDLETPPQEPWVHGPEHLLLRRRAIEDRYRLLPYLYTLAEEASRTGLPLMRPMMLEFPDIAGGTPLDRTAPSQFMLGHALLIAPEPYGEMSGSYRATLPPGQWFDFHTGLRVTDLEPANLTGNSGTTQELTGEDAPQALTISPVPETIPVFARAGCFVPMQAPVAHTRERPEGPLLLALYAAPICTGSLYDDDGLCTPARNIVRIALNAKFKDGLFRIEIGARDPDATPWWNEIALTIYGLASFDGLDHAQDCAFDAATQSLRVTLSERAEGWSISGFGTIKA